MRAVVYVSIHAPREGCDGAGCSLTAIPRVFQFTHPGRGATPRRVPIYSTARRFNSRTPGGVRLLSRRSYWRRWCFNSRTPGGVRPLDLDFFQGNVVFQFTHPGRGATACRWSSPCLWLLFQFTHPGRGATGRCTARSTTASSFNSRTPGGVRPSSALTTLRRIQFQFTHPGRGATALSLNILPL